MKRLQNKVSDSKLSLPITSVYAIGVWVLAGLIQEAWWIQFGCFTLSVYLMAVLNNSNALIRIHSRMVSCSFIMLTCTACFLFASLHEAVCTMLMAATYVVLFQTYQDKEAPGLTFYSFLLLGLSSLVDIQIICLLPFLWLLMLTNLQSLSWRNFFASLLGVTLPYWFALGWSAYQSDFTLWADHFASLVTFQTPFDFSGLDTHHVVTLCFVTVLAIFGTLHYWRASYLDKMRNRMLYGFFIRMHMFLLLLFFLQPQRYDLLLRLMILNTAPLVAHFIALTQQRVTNIIFCVITLAALFLTIYNLWM